MDSFVARQLAQLAPVHSIGTLVQIGGSLAGLADYLSLDIDNIAVAQADPGIAAQARKAAADDTRVAISDDPITVKGGSAVLHRFNLSGVSSLRAPLGLKTLFPGLVTQDKIPAQACALDVFLKSVKGLGTDKNHVLRLGLTGEEYDIVTTLKALGVLDRFASVFVIVTKEAAFQDTQSGAALIAFLEGCGYLAIGCDVSGDPELPEYHMLRSDQAQQVPQLQSQNAQHTTQIEDLEKSADFNLRKSTTLQNLVDIQDADIFDLTQKYGALVRTNQDYQLVLAQLQTRLSAAAKYLEQSGDLTAIVQDTSSQTGTTAAKAANTASEIKAPKSVGTTGRATSAKAKSKVKK